MRRLALATGLALVLAAAPARADAPKVVASIKPLHSLVSMVMAGVGEPTLLVRGAASPHAHALKPSDARALQNADVVFWIGPELEGFLEKPLKGAKPARAVALMAAPGVRLLETREGGAWAPHNHDHGHGHSHGDGHDHDSHVWLDPANGKAMVAAVAAALADADPPNAAAYRANADAATAALDALDAEIRATLAPVAGQPFVVFHDAYQYFETRYGLNGIGAITVDPERRPSAKRLSAIRERVKGLEAACVFAEPQFEPALVDTVIDGTGAKKGVLDPQGADLPDGPDLYPALLKRIAESLAGCLGS